MMNVPPTRFEIWVHAWKWIFHKSSLSTADVQFYHYFCLLSCARQQLPGMSGTLTIAL